MSAASRLVYGCALCLGFAAECSAATLDAQGNYRIDFYDMQCSSTVIYTPHDKVKPAVRSSFSRASPNESEFTYAVSNGPRARQSIETIRLLIHPPIQDPDFRGSAPAGFAFRADPWEDDGVLLSWNAAYSVDVTKPPRASIAPGSSLSGFAVRSVSLAGFAKVRLFGYVAEDSRTDPPCPPLRDGEEEHDEIGSLDEELSDLMELGVDVLVVAPTVRKGPGNETALKLKAEVARWPELHQASLKFVSRASPMFDSLASSIADGNRAATIAAANGLKRLAHASPQSDLSRQGVAVLDFDIDAIVAGL